MQINTEVLVGLLDLSIEVLNDGAWVQRPFAFGSPGELVRGGSRLPSGDSGTDVTAQPVAWYQDQQIAIGLRQFYMRPEPDLITGTEVRLTGISKDPFNPTQISVDSIDVTWTGPSSGSATVNRAGPRFYTVDLGMSGTFDLVIEPNFDTPDGIWFTPGDGLMQRTMTVVVP